MIIRTHAFARGGLVGNPSDGYFGKTISIIVRNYRAEVTLCESPDLVIVPGERDIARYDSISALVEDVQRYGYYGGVRLIKAAILRFHQHCLEHGLALERRNFKISYETNIPRLVGMGGSSAIVTATSRALMAFFGVDIPRPVQANLILSAEKDELGISAGLQDRVSQVYEGVVFMDFAREIMQKQGWGRYEALDPAGLPPLYLAFDPCGAEESGRVHNQLRARFEQGEGRVIEAMHELAQLAESARDLIASGRGRGIGPLMNRNFDIRSAICDISGKNRRMVMTARSVGGTSNFAGSGGTIIGTYEDERMYAALQDALGGIGCTVFKPAIVEETEPQ